MTGEQRAFSWFAIARLGLVQAALGSIVVMTTSTMNRIMVVELALPAMLPGALVGLHYAVQLLRPLWGHGSDRGARRTPWIVGGMVVLAAGGVGAAAATATMSDNVALGVGFAVVAFTLIGFGAGAAGTSLLALLASRVDPIKRAGSATLVWMMMIAGIVVTTIVAGHNLDPYSPERLVAVTAGVATIALCVTTIALWNVERASAPSLDRAVSERLTYASFRAALSDVWRENRARRFTIFVFVSMLAYSAQDLILEPFAGSVFGLTPGESTKLSGVQHGGVFVGMLAVGILGSTRSRFRIGTLRTWSIGGCIVSALALFGLSGGAFMGPGWPLSLNVFLLGLANGAFAVAAIGSMMELATQGGARKEGVRMGLWGAAQGVAFGLGGFIGTVAADVARGILTSPVSAYACVFAAEAALFLVSAILAAEATRGHAEERSRCSEEYLAGNARG